MLLQGFRSKKSTKRVCKGRDTICFIYFFDVFHKGKHIEMPSVNVRIQALAIFKQRLLFLLSLNPFYFFKILCPRACFVSF